MSIFRHLVGIASELLMFKDPYQKPTKFEIIAEERDCYGNVISQLVRAGSGSESTKHLRGTTPEGDRSVVSTHLTNVRRGLYDVHTEWWDKDGKGMKRVTEFNPNSGSEDYDTWKKRTGRR